MVLFDSVAYQFHSIPDSLSFEAYHLQGIETGKVLSSLHGQRRFTPIHYYKDDQGRLKLRLRETYFESLDMPYALYTSGITPSILLFLGSDITLSDLKELYLHLQNSGEYKVWIVTKRSGVSDFHYFPDRTQIWWDDIDERYAQLDLPPSPPPPSVEETRSRNTYLGAKGVLIKIDAETNNTVFANLKKDYRYVFSLDHDLPFEEYVNFKLKIRDRWKELRFEYRCEIQ